MINLLPPEEKEKLILEKNRKLAVVLGNVFVISLVCLLLVLVSLKFYILKEIKYQKSFLDDVEQKYQRPDFLSLKQTVQKYNTTLVKVNNFYKTEVNFRDALAGIFEISRPDGLFLTSVNVSRIAEKNKIKMTLSGISDTRENLLLYKSNIEESKKVENVYFPPNNWVKPKNINFNFTLENK